MPQHRPVATLESENEAPTWNAPMRTLAAFSATDPNLAARRENARLAAAALKEAARQMNLQIRDIQRQYSTQLASISAWFNQAKRGITDSRMMRMLTDQKTYEISKAKGWQAENIAAIKAAFAGVAGNPTPTGVGTLPWNLTVTGNSAANTSVTLPDGRSLSVNPAFGAVVLVTLSTGQQAYVQQANPTVPLAYPSSTSQVPASLTAAYTPDGQQVQVNGAYGPIVMGSTSSGQPAWVQQGNPAVPLAFPQNAPGNYQPSTTPASSYAGGQAPMDPGYSYSPQFQSQNPSQPAQGRYPDIESPFGLGYDLFNAPMEVGNVPVPSSTYAPSDATFVQDDSDVSSNMTLVSPDILDAMLQSQGSMYYADPWGGFSSFANQLPVSLERRPLSRQQKVMRMTTIQALNSLPTLQDFSAFEWVGPVVSAVGAIGAAAITAELTPRPKSAPAAAPIIIQQSPALAASPGAAYVDAQANAASKPAATSETDYTPWIIGGGAALVLLAVLAKKKRK